MGDFDPGPPQPFHALFDAHPDYSAPTVREHFWFDWGPIFYRGRLDGTAKVLCVASDPGPTERIAHRTLVGDAGQRVQGFLHKLGIVHSYVCLNAFVYALIPSHDTAAKAILADPDQVQWRNQVFDAVRSPSLQAVIAFGQFAQIAIQKWPGKAGLTVVKVPHPSSHTPTVLVDRWRTEIVNLRAIVTPDPGGNPNLPNYGPEFLESDYAPIPKADLPFGVPDWLGDDAWGRADVPRHNNSVSRPKPDDRHTLKWIAPTT